MKIIVSITTIILRTKIMIILTIMLKKIIIVIIIIVVINSHLFEVQFLFRSQTSLQGYE